MKYQLVIIYFWHSKYICTFKCLFDIFENRITFGEALRKLLIDIDIKIPAYASVKISFRSK